MLFLSLWCLLCIIWLVILSLRGGNRIYPKWRIVGEHWSTKKWERPKNIIKSLKYLTQLIRLYIIRKAKAGWRLLWDSFLIDVCLITIFNCLFANHIILILLVGTAWPRWRIGFGISFTHKLRLLIVFLLLIFVSIFITIERPAPHHNCGYYKIIKF